MKDMTTHFSVTSETVRKWIKTKHLPARKIGRQWRFDWEEIIEWEKGQEACPVVFESNYKDYIPAECALSANREFRNEVVHGNERLINGDCLAAMKSIADENVDLLLTDPPYNLGLFMQDRATNLKQLRSNYFGAAGWDNLEPHEWSLSMDAFFKEASRVLKTGAAMIVFMAVIKLETLIDIAQKHGFYYKTTGTWHK